MAMEWRSMTAFRHLRDDIERLRRQLGEGTVVKIDGGHWDREIGCLSELTAERQGPVAAVRQHRRPSSRLSCLHEFHGNARGVRGRARTSARSCAHERATSIPVYRRANAPRRTSPWHYAHQCLQAVWLEGSVSSCELFRRHVQGGNPTALENQTAILTHGSERPLMSECIEIETPRQNEREQLVPMRQPGSESAGLRCWSLRIHRAEGEQNTRHYVRKPDVSSPAGRRGLRQR